MSSTKLYSLDDSDENEVTLESVNVRGSSREILNDAIKQRISK